MKRRLAVFPFLALAVLACVTINVYFPEAAIKDLSEQIEEEVQKQAAEDAEPETGTDTGSGAESGAVGGVLDMLLGVSPAYASQDVPEPSVTNPAIRKIIDSRAGRLAAINGYKGRGVVGENNQALLEIIKLDAVTDLRERADVQRLVKGENADREQLYKEIAAAENVELSQLPKIRETYAATIRQKARAGDWIQLPGGEWKQK